MSYTKKFHNGYVKKSVLINASRQKIWNTISNITNLSDWIPIIKKTVLISKIKKGVGAIRKITMIDGSILEEHIVDWRVGYSLSYLAVSGLPLREYFATLLIEPINKKTTRLTWSCYIYSKKSTRKDFEKIISDFNSLYQTSVKNLKSIIERQN